MPFRCFYQAMTSVKSSQISKAVIHLPKYAAPMKLDFVFGEKIFGRMNNLIVNIVIQKKM